MAVAVSPVSTPESNIRTRTLTWRWAAVVVVLVAFGLRLTRLGDQNIWWDEGLAFWAVAKDFLGTTLWTAADVHPPIFFWILWAQVRLAGTSEFSARFVDVACGLITVATVIAMGRRLGGGWVAVAAGAMIAVARFPVWWSQELRMYAPATMFGVLATYFLMRIVDERRGYLAYVVMATLSLWTVYLSAALLVVHNIAIAVTLVTQLSQGKVIEARTLLIRWSLSQIAVTALFLPWLLFAGNRMRSWSTAEPVDPLIFLKLIIVVVTTGISTNIENYWPVAASATAGLTLIGLIAVLIRRPSRWLAGWLVVGLCLLVVPLAVFLVTQPRAIFYSPRLEVRYFLTVAPFAALAAGGAVAALARLNRYAAGVLLAIIVGGLGITTYDYLDSRHSRDEYDSIVSVLRAYLQPDDAVVLVSGDRNVLFDYYYNDLPERGPRYDLPFTVPATAASAAGDIGPLADAASRVWLVSAEAHLQDPQKQVQAWLDANRNKVLNVPAGHNNVALYTRETVPPPIRRVEPQIARPERLNESLVFLGYDLPAQRAVPGDVGHIVTFFEAAGETGPVEVALVDATGVPLETWVYALQPGTNRLQSEYSIYLHTPAGRYRAEVRSRFGTLPLGSIVVERSTPAPGGTAGTQLNQSLGEVTLLGYDATVAGSPLGVRALKPGESIDIALFWSARQRLDRPWTAFTHVIGGTLHPQRNNPIWAQDDGQPIDGTYPAQQWRPGQVIRDSRNLTIDSAAPPGRYEIEVGWYWPATNERLGGPQGRIVLGTVEVAP